MVYSYKTPLFLSLSVLGVQTYSLFIFPVFFEEDTFKDYYTLLAYISWGALKLLTNGEYSGLYVLHSEYTPNLEYLEGVFCTSPVFNSSLTLFIYDLNFFFSIINIFFIFFFLDAFSFFFILTKKFNLIHKIYNFLKFNFFLSFVFLNSLDLLFLFSFFFFSLYFLELHFFFIYTLNFSNDSLNYQFNFLLFSFIFVFFFKVLRFFFF